MIYVCAICGKERDYLSESWSTVTISDHLCDLLDLEKGTKYHYCLECRTEMKQYSEGKD